MSHNASLDMSVRFAVPAEHVWYALTNPDEAERWWPGLKLQRRKGSSICITTPRPHKKRPRTLSGKVISPAKKPYIRAVTHAHPRNYSTELTIYVSQLPSATRLRILESGFPEREHSAVIVSECRDGWRTLVVALREHLQSATNIERIRGAVDPTE